jgi:ribosomal-protein-alanine N-acetyltransferase
MAPQTDERPDLTWLRTERLEGQRIGVQHRDTLVAVLNDPRVAAWLGGVKPDEERSAQVDRWLDHWEQHGFGVWLLRRRGTAEVVGYVGLLHYVGTNIERDGDEPVVELLWGLLPAHWRQGYGSEAAQAVVSVAFEQVQLSQVVAFTMTTNEASQGVMRNVGMTYVRDFEHAELPHVLYVLRRP